MIIGSSIVRSRGECGASDMSDHESESDPRTLTMLLKRASNGDHDSEREFCELVYDELREIAQRMRFRGSGDSMGTTVVVNELLAHFIEKGTMAKSANRKYFFAVAIDQMRKMLISHYRKKKSLKKGGNRKAVPIDEALDQIADDFEARNQFDIEALEIALDRLKTRNQRQYDVVVYRFYGGLSVSETAEALGISVGSVERDWRLARAKLFAELREKQDD